MNDFIQRRPTPNKLHITVDIEAGYLRDEKLSWKAKGLITYIMTLPNDCPMSIEQLKSISKDGRDAIAAGLQELIKHGYCQRKDIRRDNGTYWGCTYEVSETKDFAK